MALAKALEAGWAELWLQSLRIQIGERTRNEADSDSHTTIAKAMVLLAYRHGCNGAAGGESVNLG